MAGSVAQAIRKLKNADVTIKGLQSVHLHWSKKGSGQTGLRKFAREHLPTMKYNNPEAKFIKEVELTETVTPTITFGFDEGKVSKLEVKGVHSDEIMEKVKDVATQGQ